MMKETVMTYDHPVVSEAVKVKAETPKPSQLRAAIPAMHICAAVTCLVLNICIPGLGTAVAGFSVFCCANPGQSSNGKAGTCCINFWVGVVQLATCWIFFIGWIWSVLWGIAFVAMSSEYNPDNRAIITLSSVSQPSSGYATPTSSEEVQLYQAGLKTYT
ncbi:protein SPEC3-like [Saccoglossus kowalevskii]|uniref:Protein SPEC3-like n=1 Tax=Saccoglossus kowalevskii TaxID=10224 RepID=A0ABM0H0Y1_SACKO|nr:PREDICTED: protein SPEC3-like [Saccoglossus kowalevskii]